MSIHDLAIKAIDTDGDFPQRWKDRLALEPPQGMPSVVHAYTIAKTAIELALAQLSTVNIVIQADKFIAVTDETGDEIPDVELDWAADGEYEQLTFKALI